MPEREHNKKRVDLNGELGMSRRDLLRRGAIAGGTLLWVAPAIQSLAPAANAQGMGQSPGLCSACYCWSGADKENPTKEWGQVDLFFPQAGQFNGDNCENWCKHQSEFGPGGVYAGQGAVNGAYAFHQYCSGTGCQTNIGSTHPHGAICQ